jgi:hypothetical protein
MPLPCADFSNESSGKLPIQWVPASENCRFLTAAVSQIVEDQGGRSAMKKISHIVRNSVLTILFLVPCITSLHAQTFAGRYSTILDSGRVNSLLTSLSKPDSVNHSLKMLFGDTFDTRLPDLVFFIDERDTNREPIIQLIQNNSKKKYLNGEPFVYVTAFIATPNHLRKNSILCRSINEIEKKTDTIIKGVSFIEDSSSVQIEAKNQGLIISIKPFQIDSNKKPESVQSDSCKELIDVHMSTLTRSVGTGEFALLSIIQGVSSSWLKDISVDGSKPDTNLSILHHEKPIKLGGNYTTDLYLVFDKLPLRKNTIHRVRLGEIGEKWVYQANIANYSSAIVTSSIGFLYSDPIKTLQPTDSIKSHPDASLFLFAHVYVLRPYIPPPESNCFIKKIQKRISLSLVFGTNLTGTTGDDIFMGGCIGHVFSKISFIGGFNYKKISYLNGARNDLTKREWHSSYGLSFVF